MKNKYIKQIKIMEVTRSSVEDAVFFNFFCDYFIF